MTAPSSTATNGWVLQNDVAEDQVTWGVNASYQDLTMHLRGTFIWTRRAPGLLTASEFFIANPEIVRFDTCVPDATTSRDWLSGRHDGSTWHFDAS